MPRIDRMTREITCTLVYDGPARSGKSTNLRYLHGRARPGSRASASWSPDLDLLALDAGAVSGFRVRFQLYAVSGEEHRSVTRRMILQGADGVVFVADSQARRVDDNLAGWRALDADLDRRLPRVTQFNKQDLPVGLILAPADLAEVLGDDPGRGVPADALHGSGVFETFDLLSRLVLQQFA